VGLCSVNRSVSASPELGPECTPLPMESRPKLLKVKHLYFVFTPTHASLLCGTVRAKRLGMETTMAAEKNYKPWNTPDFELKFREAMGRDMTRQEREFFGLMDENAGDEEAGPQSAAAPDRSQFAWQSLRCITPLLG
jgi:hypothetical protein